MLALGDTTALTAERVRTALGLVPEDEYLSILELIAQRRAGDVSRAVARLADAGIDFGSLIGGLADMLRSQLAIALGSDAAEVSAQTRAALVARRDALAPADLLRMLSAITELEPRLRKSAQQQLLVETLLIRFALLDRTVTIEDLLHEVSGDAGLGQAQRKTQSDAADRSGRALAAPGGIGLAHACRSAVGTADGFTDRRSDRGRFPALGVARRRADRRIAGSVVGRCCRACAWRNPVPASGGRAGGGDSDPRPCADEVTLRFADSNEIYPRAIEAGRAELLAALRCVFRRSHTTSLWEPMLRRPLHCDA